MRKEPIDWKNVFKVKHWIDYAVLAVFLIVMIILNGSGILGKADRSTLVRIGFSMVLAVSLNLVVGFLGELSLGHAGFMCVGAYIGCYVSNFLEASMGVNAGSLIISMLIGGAVAAVFGFIIGIPALRLKGDYLAITTLAFGEIVRNIFKNLSIFGGAKGLSTDNYPSQSLFIVAFITLIVVVFLTNSLIRSKHGRAITSVRDNEIAAKAMGINVTFYKLFVFTLAAFFAGIAGVLYGKCFGTVRQETFDYNYSIEILVMVVLGGLASVRGSMIAAAIITYVNILLQSQLSGSLAPVKLIVYALILIFMILFNNAPAFEKIKTTVVTFFKRLFGKMRPRGPEEEVHDENDWRRIETKIHMDEILRTGMDSSEENGEIQRGGK